MAELELQESVIHINRVAKVVKGGRNFAFTALVAVGDGNGKAGIGYGKGSEVPLAIQKAIENAKKYSRYSNGRFNNCSLHNWKARIFKSTSKPAAPGTGVIAGGAARQVLEVAGVKDILAKSLGSPTHLNVAKATINGLLNQRTPDMVAGLRGKTIRGRTSWFS